MLLFTAVVDVEGELPRRGRLLAQLDVILVQRHPHLPATADIPQTARAQHERGTDRRHCETQQTPHCHYLQLELVPPVMAQDVDPLGASINRRFQKERMTAT